MIAKIVHISNSKKVAMVSVAKSFGPVSTDITGFVKLNDPNSKKGDTFEIPDTAEVSLRAVGEFNWLVIQ